MKIKDLYAKKKPVLSLEVFPPKKAADVQTIYSTLGALSALSPDFISVTYGSGGGEASQKTGEIASAIQSDYQVTALAHLTCIASDRRQVAATAETLEAAGIQNILALRGDIPQAFEGVPPQDFRYSQDLIAFLKERGGFCVGAACYPEGHIDCPTMEEGIGHLKEKQAAGADYFITQLFFDNELFFRFRDRAEKAGITLPVSAGVMPFLSRGQIEKMIFLCGSSLPSRIIKLLHKYQNSPEDLKQAGMEYAAEQLCGLARGGADGVHVYTMNRPEIASYTLGRLREAL